MYESLVSFVNLLIQVLLKSRKFSSVIYVTITLPLSGTPIDCILVLNLPSQLFIFPSWFLYPCLFVGGKLFLLLMFYLPLLFSTESTFSNHLLDFFFSEIIDLSLMILHFHYFTSETRKNFLNLF